MTKRPKTLIQAVYLALLLMLLPSIALSQDQAAPNAPQPEKTAQEPAAQKSGSLITPDQQKQEPAAATTIADEKAAPAEAPVEAQPTPASEEPSYYVIKQGDTLWDISNTFMKDPFLWPFIWKANPSISNPDLIYPGNKLAIPSMAPIERAMQAPEEEKVVEKQAVVQEPVKKEPAPKAPEEKTAAVEEAAPSEVPAQREGIAAARVKKPKPVQAEAETASPGSLLILPEDRPLPIIDKYAMLSAGFINQEESADIIVGPFEDGKENLSFDDIVYVKIGNPEKVRVGDKFLIYTQKNGVQHPKTGEFMGHLIKGLGILQITAKDSPTALKARITLSFDTIEKNNLLTPYQEPSLIYTRTEKKSKDISGVILEVTDERSVNSQSDFVYLDKGSVEGVEAGDRFAVYIDQEDSDLPRKNIGEVYVFLVKEHTSTAFVRRSIQELVKGNVVEFKK